MTYNVEFSAGYLVDHIGIGGVGETPVVGDFNGDGLDDLGVYIPNGTNARWAFEMNRGNGVFPGGPDVRHTGIGSIGETPIVGDFNRDGLDDIGVYVPNSRNAKWAFSMNRGNGIFPPTFDVAHFGIGALGETPIAGDFNGDGWDDIGVYVPNSRNAKWAFSMNRGNGIFSPTFDVAHFGIGALGETPIAGDFNSDGLDDIGVYIPDGTVGALWAFTMNRGNGVFPGTYDVKRVDTLGGAGATPVVGEFNTYLSRDDLGVYIPNGTTNAHWAIKRNNPVEVFNSNRSAAARLELDFDGDFIANWGRFRPRNIPAYDTDGRPLTFTDDERANIKTIFDRVAEKFSPFNLNVTTDVTSDDRDKREFRIVIGGDNGPWYENGTQGGVAEIGGFYNDGANVGFVFSANRAGGLPRSVADAIAHEAGHGFGLEHQSDFDGNVKIEEYNDNDPATTDANGLASSVVSVAPIMGSPNRAERGVWWHGRNSNGDLIHDVDVLANTDNGFDYRPDDHGNTLATATKLTLADGELHGEGIIPTTRDTDRFTFTLSTAGIISLRLTPAKLGPMLNASLNLLDVNGLDMGTPITGPSWSNRTGALPEIITWAVPAGSYQLHVEGSGREGDIGQYTVDGYFMTAGGPYAVDAGGWVSLSAGPAAGEAARPWYDSNYNSTVDYGGLSYDWDFDYDGTTFTTDAWGLTAVFSAVNISGPTSRTVALRVTDELGVTRIDTAVVNVNRSPTLSVAEVFIASSAWPPPDGNPANVTFKEHLESKGLGDDVYGFRIDDLPASATLPWINMNRLVLRFNAPVAVGGLPSAGGIGLDGLRSDYTVTAVEQLDPQTVVLTLDRALGLQPAGAADPTLGDRIRLTVPGAGPGGSSYTTSLNVLQGDADRALNTRVATSDVNFVKARLNRTSSEVPPAGAAYSVFADLDGNGRIQISDVNAVKARINDVLPAVGAFSEVRVMAVAPARDIAARPPRRGLLDGDPAGLLA